MIIKFIPQMKKTIGTMVIILIAILSIYWIKNLSGVNIFESYSFSKYFPFKYLQSSSTLQPAQPISGETIIDESFNTRFSFKREWSNLRMVEKGKVTLAYDKKGFHNSRCLLMKSTSDKHWIYSYLNYIGVKRGDVFSYSGYLKIQGESTSVLFCFASFDKDKNVIKWDFEKTKINQHNKVIKVSKQFTINDEVAFIRFRIIGEGVGEFRFDDIGLGKL